MVLSGSVIGVSAVKDFAFVSVTGFDFLFIFNMHWCNVQKCTNFFLACWHFLLRYFAVVLMMLFIICLLWLALRCIDTTTTRLKESWLWWLLNVKWIGCYTFLCYLSKILQYCLKIVQNHEKVVLFCSKICSHRGLKWTWNKCVEPTYSRPICDVLLFTSKDPACTWLWS